MPNVHRFAGSNKARQEVGDPGHCEDCVLFGHLVAHPDLGCGDVGCDATHGTVDAATPGPWQAYFTVHGDPFVVPAARPYPTSAIATVSTAPNDYGRANALLLAAAPDLLACAVRWATGWTDVVSQRSWAKYVGERIGTGNSVAHERHWEPMTDGEVEVVQLARRIGATATDTAPGGTDG